MEGQSAECRTNDLLIATYEQLLSDAAYRRNAWNTLLGETADDAAPLRLLGLLQIAVKRPHPKANRCRRARLVLMAFHGILDALFAYRQDWIASPRFPDEIRRQVVRHLKSLKRTREQDLAGSLEKLIVEPNLGRDLLWALKQTVDKIATETVSRDSQAPRALSERIQASPSADPEPWVLFASADPDLIGEIVDRTIKRLEPEDADGRLKTRLRNLVRSPTERRWSSAVRLMLRGGEYQKNVAIFRAMSVGHATGLFPDQLPSNWVSIVGEDERRIRQFSEELLDQLNRVADDKPGRPTVPALQAYVNEVNAAYRELTGKDLTLTRPTERSAPEKRSRTTGFGLDVMTAALQLVDASMGPKQARTAIERLAKH